MVTVDLMPLIHRDNRAFLEGKREQLAQPSEALANLAASIGVKAPPVGSGCVGCTSIFILGLGVMGTVAGLIMLIVATTFFKSILHTRPMHLSDIALAALLLSVGMTCLIHIGHRYILQSYWSRTYLIYTRQLYRELIAVGEIVEGTVTSVEQGTPHIVHYRFSVPALSSNYNGQYKLFTPITLVPGQKVTVLYLNRCTSILL